MSKSNLDMNVWSAIVWSTFHTALGMTISGFTFMTLYNWFISPLSIGLFDLGFLESAGVLVAVKFIFPMPKKNKKKINRKYYLKSLSNIFGKAFMFLWIGYIITRLMESV